MVNLTERLGSAVDSACMGFINAGVTVNKGFLAAGECASRNMYEVYSLQGFEKWSKAIIANMKAVQLIPGCQGIFKNTLKTMEAQKDLIYATLVFESSADFIKVTKSVDEDTGEETTSYSFTLPRENNGNIEWVKLLYGIGNPLDSLYFLHKYKVVSFPFFSKVASTIGGTQLFTLRGEAWTFSDIPFMNCLVNKPKDFFVCIASGYTTYKCLTSSNFWDLANLIKLSGNVGKIILITSADYMVQKKYFVALAVVDVVTQNASLIGLLMKRSRDREARFKDPTKF